MHATRTLIALGGRRGSAQLGGAELGDDVRCARIALARAYCRTRTLPRVSPTSHHDMPRDAVGYAPDER